MSGAEDFSQYGEATEDESDEKETTKSDSKKKISKEDFFSNLDALTNLLKGDEDNTQADNSE